MRLWRPAVATLTCLLLPATGLGLGVAAAARTAAPSTDTHPRPGAGEPTTHPSARTAHALGAQRAADVSVRRSPGGALQFVGTAPGHPLMRPHGVSTRTRPGAAAARFVSAHARLFGLTGPAAGVRVRNTAPALGRATTARLTETIGGQPVMGGELVVELTPANRILTVSARTLSDAPAATRPQLSAPTARRLATAITARSERVSAAALRAGRAALTVTSLPLLGVPSTDTAAHLAYRVEVTGHGGQPVRELVLLDAATGAALFAANETEYVDTEQVCTAQDRLRVTDPTCPPTPGVKSQPMLLSSYSGDALNAKTLAGDVYAFYRDVVGSVRYLGVASPTGRALNSTVHMCDSSSTAATGCLHMENAFWDGHEMVYGDGWSSADDIVGHELTHSVTEHTSNLFYWYQSGAINESMSDVMGELFDQWNGAGTDTPQVKWMLGEDLPQGTVLRDMANPTVRPTQPGLDYSEFTKQPDSMASPLYQSGTRQVRDQQTGQASPRDMGGVHINSGVGNKAAYLIVDGGSLNGITVAGLGGASNDPQVQAAAIKKAAHIYFHADQLLTSGAQYADLYDVLPQACDDLAAAGTAGITTTDCVSVRRAVRATKMNVAPAGAGTHVAPGCDATTGTTLWCDDFEHPGKDLWSRSPRGGYGPWYYPASRNVYSNTPMVYTTSGKLEAWGDDPDPFAAAKQGISLPRDGTLSMNHGVLLPRHKTTYVTFNDAYQFEWYAPTSKHPALFVDGGRVEYSVDHGRQWTDAGGLFDVRGYNHHLVGFNAKGTRVIYRFHGFGGDSFGYTSSRLDLTPLRGKRVWLRFRDTSDAAVGATGWFIDDVRFFTQR
jgi:bacillolysin